MRKAKFNVVAGLTIGKIIVLKFSHKDAKSYKWWVVRCSCGDSFLVREDSLRAGRPQRCSKCRRAGLNLIGMIFGKWKVLSLAGPRKIGHDQRRAWNVRCSCSLHTERTVLETSLLSGRSQSCKRCPNEFRHLPDGTTVLFLESSDGEKVQCVLSTPDYPLVKDYWWSARKSARGLYYALSRRKQSDPPGAYYVRMHRIIRSDIIGEVDHEDRNGLNNCRHNLRPATRSQQMQNCRPRKHSSRYRGVSRNSTRAGVRGDKPWQASISSGGKSIGLGYFSSEKAAARAYDVAAMKHHGTFANLNFKDS